MYIRDKEMQIIINSIQYMYMCIVTCMYMYMYYCAYACTRNLEHSTILHEDSKQQPLLRLAWNRQDPNYLATFAVDSAEVTQVEYSDMCST